jgi:PPOX class probable F420-dependent enzyme
MDESEVRRRFRSGRVARLATVAADGSPRIVPVCFELDGNTVVTAVDAKPKSTTALARLDNIRAHPRVSLVVDEYDDDDWARLWWVRADGSARVAESGADLARAIELLTGKYRQYRAAPLAGPAILVEVDRFSAWSAAG